MRKLMVLASGAAAFVAAQSGQMMVAAGAGTVLALHARPALAATCPNGELDRIIRDLTKREPFTNECEMSQYGSGDLRKAVAVKLGYASPEPVMADPAKGCVNAKFSAAKNAEMTRAVRELTLREPFAGECDGSKYNGGQWSSYAELKNLIAVSLGLAAPPPKPATTQARTQAPAYSIQSVGPRASSLPKADVTGNFPVNNAAPDFNVNLGAPKNPTPVDMAKLPVVKTPKRDAKVDFIEQNFSRRKTYANTNIGSVRRIGGQDYFKVGNNWFLQTSNDPRSRTGIEVPGMNMVDLSTVTQTRTQDGRTYFKSGERWMQLIGNDGSTLIGNDGSTLIGNDSGGFISTNGGNLVAAGGGNLVGNDGASFNIASLVGNDGASLISNVARSFISTNGSTVSPVDASKILSNANAALVAAGGGNMVAAGGGNMVAAGGGNLTIDLLRRAVPTNAGNRATR